MGMGEAVHVCFERFFRFSGRAARPEFWWFFLFVFLAGVILSLVDQALFGAPPPSTLEQMTPEEIEALDEQELLRLAAEANDPLRGARYTPISTGFTLLTLIPYLAVTWRRLHDVGKSGWFGFVPLVGFAVAGIGAVLQSPMLMMAGGGAGVVLQIIVIVWLASRGDAAENRFGPPPGSDHPRPG